MLSFLDLLVPPAVMLGSLATLPFTLLWLPITGRFEDFTSRQRFRHSWFQHFWTWFGPGSKPLFVPAVKPLLAQAKGVVLELGPGNGVWMNELSLAYKAGHVTKIYGVESNTLFHDELRRKAKAAGLDDVYERVGALVQDLETVGIKKGSIDTVITVHVLCSVGHQAEEIVHHLYEYLKPGGQWLVFEHVVSPNGLVKGWQAVNNVVWGELLDGCDLTKDTGDMLKNAGEWTSSTIGPDKKEGYFECLPHCAGVLVK